MSDAPNGPGWWLASDGRWYPPEAAPAPAAPPPPPPAPPAPTGAMPPPHPAPGAPYGAIPAPPPAPPGPPVAADGDRSTFEWVTLGGAAAVIVGSLLPWATLSSPFGSISKSGTEGDGVITIVLALVAGGLVLARKAPIATIVLMALTALVAVIDIADVSRVAGDNDFATVSVGIGLWVVLLGAAASLFGAIQHRRTRPRT